jgi:hypothetical protein
MGMLFDHGCDATTAILGSMILQRVGQIGSGWQVILCLMFTTIPFYYLILEEYYLGILV